MRQSAAVTCGGGFRKPGPLDVHFHRAILKFLLNLKDPQDPLRLGEALEVKTMAAITKPQLEDHLLAGVAHRIADRLQVALTEAHRMQRQVRRGCQLRSDEFELAIESVREAGEINKRMVSFFFGGPDPAGARPQDLNILVQGLGALLRCGGGTGFVVNMQLEPRLPLALADYWEVERDLLHFVLSNQERELDRLTLTTSTVAPLRGQPASRICITARLERGVACRGLIASSAASRGALKGWQEGADRERFTPPPARGPHAATDEVGLGRFYFPIAKAARTYVCEDRRTAEG
jgi:hypothetical protein